MCLSLIGDQQVCTCAQFAGQQRKTDQRDNNIGLEGHLEGQGPWLPLVIPDAVCTGVAGS